MNEKQNNTNQSFANPYHVNPYYYYPQPNPVYYPTYQARQQPQTQQPQFQEMLPTQQSYIENILRLNQGKQATVYMTFENNKEQIFTGIIEAAGRDHIILSDPETGIRYLLLMVYLDYVTFNEEINYTYPFAGAAGPTSTNSPR